jgi:hypothetical protein
VHGQPLQAFGSAGNAVGYTLQCAVQRALIFYIENAHDLAHVWVALNKFVHAPVIKAF